MERTKVIQRKTTTNIFQQFWIISISEHVKKIVTSGFKVLVDGKLHNLKKRPSNHIAGR